MKSGATEQVAVLMACPSLARTSDPCPRRLVFFSAEFWEAATPRELPLGQLVPSPSALLARPPEPTVPTVVTRPSAVSTASRILRPPVA